MSGLGGFLQCQLICHRAISEVPNYLEFPDSSPLRSQNSSPPIPLASYYPPPHHAKSSGTATVCRHCLGHGPKRDRTAALPDGKVAARLHLIEHPFGKRGSHFDLGGIDGFEQCKGMFTLGIGALGITVFSGPS